MKEVENFKKYFSITEVVSRSVAKKYGEQAWSFFDPRLLEVLVWLREGINVPLVINTSTQQQRGFRENTSDIVSQKTKANSTYCSAHTLGKGVDLSSASKTAKEIRNWIRENIQSCPHPIRLEGDKSAPTWVHIDVCNISKNKLQEFEV